MKDFHKGVSFYTKGKVNIDINFPEDDICCRWCMFLKSDLGINRCTCRITGEILFNPDYARGVNCPIEIEKE